VSARTADKRAVTATKSNRPAIFAISALCVAVFIAALDQNMVYTIMKPLMTDLGLDPTRQLSEAAWIITGYLLGYTVAMPLFGRLTDVKGRRLMTVVALLLFMLGSALCVFIRRLDLFVVARVIQAAGGGALVPIAMSAGADLFPLRRRALVLGVVAGSAEAGSVLGVLYGPALALLPSALGLVSNPDYWPLIFMVNIPLCLVLGAVCWWVLRGDVNHAAIFPGQEEAEDEPAAETPPETQVSTRWWHRGQVDYIGAGVMGFALASAMIGLGTGSELLGSAYAGQTSPLSWPWLVGAAAAFVIFVLYERRHPRPLVRLAFFKIPAFAAANLANFLVGVALVIGMAGISILGQTLFGLTPLGAGFLLIQLILPMPLGAVAGGWLADRIGCKITGILGFIIAATGYFLVSRWSMTPSFAMKLASLVVAGVGLGFVLGPIGTSATSPVGQKWMATGSALVTVSRMVGMAIGLSAISSWGVRRVSTLSARSLLTIPRPSGMSELDYQSKLQSARLMDATHQVFGEFFLIAAIVIAAGVVAAVFFYNHRERGMNRLPLT
jgi:MFS family permease